MRHIAGNTRQFTFQHNLSLSTQLVGEYPTSGTL